jgi:hypothetical protein
MKPSSKLENAVKVKLKEVGLGGMGWIYLAQDEDQ